ncbi:MAG: hypothetical protein IIB27_04590 [Chloroflexi bacterium]|nr:hypothetical protein [Chloroflexota bacterium]
MQSIVVSSIDRRPTLSDLILPGKGALLAVRDALQAAPPPVSWRVVARDLDASNRFQVLLDDDRTIQVTPDPEPRHYVPGGEISLIDLLFYYPRRPIGGANALNWAHRFTDRLNWHLVTGVALVDNDTDLGPYGSMWLKHVINLRGGVTAGYLANQVDAFIASMEIVRRLHEAEPDSPLADGKWMGRG